MIRLALDLGPQTGWCVGTAGAHVSGSWSLRTDGADSGRRGGETRPGAAAAGQDGQDAWLAPVGQPSRRLGETVPDERGAWLDPWMGGGGTAVTGRPREAASRARPAGHLDGGGLRLGKFRARLAELHDAWPIGRVAYAAAHRQAGSNAAQTQGALLGVLRAWCEENGIPHESVPVAEMRASWCVRADAAAPAMIHAAIERGYAPSDEKEAGAVALFLTIERLAL